MSVEPATNPSHRLRLALGFIAALCLPAAIQSARAADAGAILGIWNNQEKSARIEIFQCEARYCGKIVWLKNPNYAKDSKNGISGTPMLDHNNPDPQLRTTPLVGLTIMRNFAFDGDDVWSGGSIYDPKNGKTYKGKMTLASPGELTMRGYIGFALLGRDTTWTR